MEDGDFFRYETVATYLEATIADGDLKPGDRLPSVRVLSRQQRVSVATVRQAYVVLESRGIVECRPQSGHYVAAPSKRSPLAEPRAHRFSARIARVTVSDLVASMYEASNDAKLVALGGAKVCTELLPVEKLNRRMSLVARDAGRAGIEYDMPQGFLGLRRQIARRVATHGVVVRPDEILTTVGAREAISLCLQAVAKPGDTIAVESPTYYGALQLVEALGLRAIEIPSNPATGLDIDLLDDAIQRHPIAACLAMPNFSNPVGALMPDESKRRLVTMLARRDIPLIEDDVYGDLHFGSERPRPAKAFDRAGNVLLCSSFSKTLAPGYRVGYVVPGRFYERVVQLKFAQTFATMTLAQMAVAEFLADGSYARHLRRLRPAVERRLREMGAKISALFPEGTRLSRPSGGLVLWLELPGGKSAMELHRRALAAGILIAPGPMFSAAQRFTNCVRLNCAVASSPVLDRALATLASISRAL